MCASVSAHAGAMEAQECTCLQASNAVLAAISRHDSGFEMCMYAVQLNDSAHGTHRECLHEGCSTLSATGEPLLHTCDTMMVMMAITKGYPQREREIESAPVRVRERERERERESAREREREREKDTLTKHLVSVPL